MKKYIVYALFISLIFVNDRNRNVLAGVNPVQNDMIEVPVLTNWFKETSSYMAGMDLPEKSGLEVLTKRPDYAKYREAIDRNWNKYFGENMKKCRTWSDKFLPQRYNPRIFYPFSGPDILHPLTFYPEGNDIIMFGLEPVGVIPDPLMIPKNREIRDLWALPGVVNFTLRHAFFVTMDMGKSVGLNPYTGITGVIMFFLAKGGYDVLYVKKIWLNSKGELVTMEPTVKENSIPGMEFVFKRSWEGDLKRARYFRLDISDRSPKFPVLAAFVEKGSGYTTIIKSASYLMYNTKTFGKIRNLILEKSESIIQDDSGMPLNAFSEKQWKITYHGYYHRPILDFKMHFQKDLQDKMKQNTTGSIPFVYGYGYGFNDMTYHLIHAEKFPVGTMVKQ